MDNETLVFRVGGLKESELISVTQVGLEIHVSPRRLILILDISLRILTRLVSVNVCESLKFRESRISPEEGFGKVLSDHKLAGT